MSLGKKKKIGRRGNKSRKSSSRKCRFSRKLALPEETSSRPRENRKLRSSWLLSRSRKLARWLAR